MLSIPSKFTVLITGASGGIGSSLALEYAAEDVLLILFGRNLDALATLALLCEERGAVVKTYCIDFSSIDESLQLSCSIAKSHRIDLLIANAGITNSTSNGETEAWDKIESLITVNLLGALAISHAILEDMQRRRAGHIAYVSSLGAFYGMPITPAYCASKAGLKAYAEAMRGLLRDKSIMVSLITPGFVKTGLSDQFTGSKPFMISPEDAAVRIKRGLDKKKRVIAFPFPLTIGMRVLSCLPSAVADWILSRLKY